MKYFLKKLFVPIVLLLLFSSTQELFGVKITRQQAIYLASVACPTTDKDGETIHHDRREVIVAAIENQEYDDVVWNDVLNEGSERSLFTGHLTYLNNFVDDKIGALRLGNASQASGMGKGAILVGVGFLIAYLAQNRDRVAELAKLADEDPKAFAEFVWGEAKGLAGLSKDVVMAVFDLGIADLKPSTYTSFTENPVGNGIRFVVSLATLVGGGYAVYKGGTEVKRRHDKDGKSWAQATYLTDNRLVCEKDALIYNTDRAAAKKKKK